eukprot:6283345-Pyramimonas_sp.AAC.1
MQQLPRRPRDGNVTAQRAERGNPGCPSRWFLGARPHCTGRLIWGASPYRGIFDKTLPWRRTQPLR